MSFFDDILSDFESSFTTPAPMFNQEKLQAVIDTMTQYEQAIDSDCSLEVLVQYESVIKQYVQELMSVLEQYPDLEDTAEFDIIVRKAFGFGIIDQAGCLRESYKYVAESDPVLNSASRSLAGMLDTRVEPKAAVQRAVKFAAKKHNISEVSCKYKYYDQLVGSMNGLI